MTRNDIAERYLEHMRHLGVTVRDVVKTVHSAADFEPTTYAGRFLQRPAFLAAAERAQIDADLNQLHRLLRALPQRLYGGDLAAFARATGLTDEQVSAVLRSQTATAQPLGRADLYHDGTNFRLMELNLGSALGGLDNALLNEAFLTHPVAAQFLAGSGLSYVDTMAEIASMLGACAAGRGQRPLVAAVDWPASFETLEPQLQASADALGAFGIEVLPCHLGQLEFRGGRVWLRGRTVEVIYRLFLLEDLTTAGAPQLVDPVLEAVQRGGVALFSPMDDDLYGSKATLAMLSDEANRHLFDATELTSLDRLLPWTRMVRDGMVTVDGEHVDLIGYATAHQAELVLKPTLQYGGTGVVLGWQVDTARWQRELAAAIDGPSVLQARIRGVPEPFPTTDGDQAPMLLKWGVFIVASGYGGSLVSGSTDLSGAVLNGHGGATLGCCFHQS